MDIFSDIKDRANEAKDNLLNKIGLSGTSWPQTSPTPPFGRPGFLPPQLITPTIKLVADKKSQGFFDNFGEESQIKVEAGVGKLGSYTYRDWMGLKITEDSAYKLLTSLKTKDRFNLGINIPRDSESLEKLPYSSRDTLLLYNDSTQDYFKYGLQSINNINNDFPETQPTEDGQGSTARLYNYLNSNNGTPYELNDPPLFGFEIIIDAVSSPLLNGSIYDFFSTYENEINEIKSKKEVYEDFKNQFKKLFKTKGTVRVDEGLTKMTNLGSNPSTLETGKGIYNPGRRAYMSYYLKKVEGLEFLTEKNTPGTKKYLVDYGKDVIKLDFYEDVSLTLGTLAHLYKLLYWSKPNGKGLIPENLLRFNCEIVVSECRNFNRVRKAVNSGNLEIIKDNVSRYIYSLRECQFYFDVYSHPASIDMSNLQQTDSYAVQFDYKYSSVKFEKWTPGTENFGKYVGYNNGALWKLGNVGNDRGATFSKSVPSFLTIGGNTLFQNGVTKPMILKSDFKIFGKKDETLESIGTFPSDDLATRAKSQLENFAKRSEKKAIDLAKQSGNRLVASVVKEAQGVVNKQFALLNKSINKILNGIGIEGIRPPRNIYTGQGLGLGGRLFYDLRGELLNFVGGFTGNQLFGQGSSDTIVVPPKPSKPNPFRQDSRTAKELYGTSDFNQIQFPNSAQKYPSPIFTKK
jgi:hypothetical protein